MSKKLIWIIIALVVIVVGLIVLKKNGLLGKEEGIKVAVEKTGKRTIIETVNASGKLSPEVEVKVSPDISGEITELTVAEGDSVKKGQVLARIYADIYTTQRDQAAAVVNQQEASVSNSSAQLQALKASLDQTKRAYDRQKQLLDEKVISRSEFEQAENAFLSAEANYNAAMQGIRGGQASVSSARANLSKADKDLSRTAIIAPMNGIISLLNVKKGERVVGNSMMAGTEMMRVADLNVMEVIVDVGENDIPKVNLGDSAIVEIDAYTNHKFKGIVTQIASSNSTASQSAATTSNDVTNYKVHIRLLTQSYKDMLDDPKNKRYPFRPGMSASADIQTKRHENVVVVPINAVTTREKNSDKPAADAQSNNIQTSAGSDADKDTRATSSDLEEVAFVVQKDGTVKKVKVSTDIQDLNYIQVTDGLQEGEQVVTAPYSTVSKLLKSGSKVMVVDKDKLYDTKK